MAAIFDPQTWGGLRGCWRGRLAFWGSGKGFGRPYRGNFCGSKMVAIFDPQTLGGLRGRWRVLLAFWGSGKGFGRQFLWVSILGKLGVV